MHWVRDRTGRFRWRPYYQPADIDALCEDRIERFLRARYGVVEYPILTDDLTRLIEQEASDLDLYADLSGHAGAGMNAEGVTTFYWHRRPMVQIAQALSLDARREPRLRTTLAHELGHVLLHDFAHHDAGDDVPPMDESDADWPAVCSPAVATPGQADWMEWQAGYASGALLMPRTAVQQAIFPSTERHDASSLMAGGLGRAIDIVQGHFMVSDAAALMRLRQLGYAPARGHDRDE